MNKSDFIKHLSKIFEKKENKINEKSLLSELGWDSLKILELMAFNDLHFKSVKISPDQLNKCVKVADLIKLYGKKIK
tara:strand:- start:796 stop:1026 length:231 start_codon:yes stop_codon:yes gene_type:complete